MSKREYKIIVKKVKGGMPRTSLFVKCQVSNKCNLPDTFLCFLLCFYILLDELFDKFPEVFYISVP